MKIVERSWIVFLLWLGSLVMALGVPPAQKDVFFTLTYLFGGLLVFSFLWAWLNLHWTRVTRRTRSRRSQVGKYAEERFIVEPRGIFTRRDVRLDCSNLRLPINFSLVREPSAERFGTGVEVTRGFGE